MVSHGELQKVVSCDTDDLCSRSSFQVETTTWALVCGGQLRMMTPRPIETYGWGFMV